MKKIAIILPSLKFGGAERVSLNLAKAFKNKGYNVDILLMKYTGEFIEEAKIDLNIVDLNCNKTYKLPLKISKYIINNKPDIIISNFWKINLCTCVVKIMFRSLKLILWEHSPPSKTPTSPIWLYYPTVSLLYKMANSVVAVSEGVKLDIIKSSIGLSNKIIKIYNPVAPPSFDDFEIKKNQTSDSIVIISVGRLDPQKNPKLLIKAFARVAQNNNNVKLLIIGDGILRKDLEKLCEDLKISDRVRFAGFVLNPYHYLKKSDIFILTSDYEGLPTVIIEALYCGLPIISTDCPSGPRELLENGKYGLLVELNNLDQLVNAIELQLSMQKSDKSKIYAMENFSPEIIVDKFIKLL